VRCQLFRGPFSTAAATLAAREPILSKEAIMSISLATTSPVSPISAQPVRATSPERQDFKSLAKALRSGNLADAKTAYANIVKDAPAGATFPSGSPFAEVGKALMSGDVDAAKTAFGSMVKNATGKGGGAMLPPVISLPPSIAPVASTTGGTAGGTFSEVA
jgi:hypothetical protein